jgi:hypothetical protein
MKTPGAFFVFLISFFAFVASSSANLVGYYNLPIHAGDNLVANHFQLEDSTLNAVFGNGIPDGTTFSKWDLASRQFLPTSTYSSGNGWSINYDFRPGEGAIFNTSVTFTNTFVGEVDFDGKNLVFTYPTLPVGENLLSCSVPYQSDFFHVIGRNPYDHESVRRLDLDTQTYQTSTFQNGVWNNGDPVLRVGESAFFSLVAPASPVPEPRVVVLLAGSLLVLGSRRFTTRRKE